MASPPPRPGAGTAAGGVYYSADGSTWRWNGASYELVYDPAAGGGPIASGGGGGGFAPAPVLRPPGSAGGGHVIDDGIIVAPLTPTNLPVNPSVATGGGGGGDGGGGGGGGGGGPSAPAAPPLDWRAWLENWGFPSDVVNDLDRIFRSYTDPSFASAAALAYIRGTDWYHATFRGIEAGKRLGVVRDERDYRAYVNALNQQYRRYYQRDISLTEVEALLNEGVDPATSGMRLEGEADVAARGGDYRYLLGAFGEGRPDDAELTALGRQRAGLSSTLGMKVLSELQKAEARMSRLFSGDAATSPLAEQTIGRSLGRTLELPDVGR